MALIPGKGRKAKQHNSRACPDEKRLHSLAAGITVQDQDTHPLGHCTPYRGLYNVSFLDNIAFSKECPTVWSCDLTPYAGPSGRCKRR